VQVFYLWAFLHHNTYIDPLLQEVVFLAPALFLVVELQVLVVVPWASQLS
jgi:hypothetical protein